MNKEKIIVTSGEFDPLSVKDLRFLQKCKSRGHWLVVGIHSNVWMSLCRGGCVQPYNERHEIIQSLKCVDEVFKFNDDDGTVCNLLRLVKGCYPLSDITYISDEDMHDMPETRIRGINFEVLR